nr:iron chelate uptake ABC transporter family permease subunit [Nesterenkonia ebinurensis]
MAYRFNLRSLVVCLVMVILTVLISLWALASGDYELTIPEVWGALLNDPEAGFARTVVVGWRLPRVLGAVVFGAALGASGAIFQSLTRNPLASPDIIGFSTGSYTGALVVIIVIGGGYLHLAAGALVGGILTALAVYLLAWRRGVQGFRLIIVGIGISAMLASLNTWLILRADLDVAMSAAAWGAGSLNATTWDQLTHGTLAILILFALLMGLAPSQRQLELGDDAAKATGVKGETSRLALVVVGVALTATVTASAGPISFIALAAPQIARRLARTPGVTLVPAAITGALGLAAADYTAQHLLPSALPVGVVTVVLGGGYLVWLLIHEMRKRP